MAASLEIALLGPKVSDPPNAQQDDEGSNADKRDDGPSLQRGYQAFEIRSQAHDVPDHVQRGCGQHGTGAIGGPANPDRSQYHEAEDQQLRPDHRLLEPREVPSIPERAHNAVPEQWRRVRELVLEISR